MKCIDNTGDCKADAVVRNDGQFSDEYGTHLADDGAICSWIPVNDGAKIVVETGFTGMTKEIQIDLVIDGILRNSVKTNRKAEKKDRISERFAHGFYAQSKSVINQAELEIKALDVSSYPSIQAEGKDSVGTIEVRISVLRDEHEEHHKLDDVKSFETIMDWKEAHRTPSYTKIRPVQQVDFIPIDQEPSKTQITKLKQRASGRRPGAKPWVVFRFFYRQQEAINSEALTKTASKMATKFDAPPVVKTADQSATTPRTLAGTTSATTTNDPSTKAGTVATTAEDLFPKAATIAEAWSTKDVPATATAEAPGNKATGPSDAVQIDAFKSPVPDREHGVSQLAVSNTDLGSTRPDLVAETISAFSPANNPKSSTSMSTGEHTLPSYINKASAMTTIDQQPAPVANMIPELGATAAENPTPPSTPKPVNELVLPEVYTIAASLFDTSSPLRNTPATEIIQTLEAPKPSVLNEATKEVPEPMVHIIDTKVEPVSPLTPQSTEKLKIEPSKSSNTLKRVFCATPTPDPATKRLKVENGELEKRYAERKKALAEKRANRIKSQNKASDAEKKAADAEARRKEALEKMLAEMDDEIAEEERLAREAEESLEAIEAVGEEHALEGSDTGEF